MFFLSLIMDLLLALGGGASIFAVGADGNTVNQHTIHGHLPGPADPHFGTSHIHHGAHGHTAGSSGHEVFH